jgi:hypothetical protein
MPATGIQKCLSVTVPHQSTPVAKPKMKAGAAIGTVMMAATIAKKTAINTTASNRITNQRDRGSTDVGSLRSRVVPTISISPRDRSNAVNSK